MSDQSYPNLVFVLGDNVGWDPVVRLRPSMNAEASIPSIGARALIGALLLYNLAVTGLLIYAAVGLDLAGFGLGPVVLLHAVMAIWCVASLRMLGRVGHLVLTAAPGSIQLRTPGRPTFPSTFGSAGSDGCARPVGRTTST